MLGAGPLRKVFFRTIQKWLVAVGVGEEGALLGERALRPFAFRNSPTAGVRLGGD